ncbi:MAG: helix-turn-helix domain-containing protein [Agathobacter sp.]|nr:helix-turn-helix domain-containing protein [Agathobacter sp.]
MNLVNQCRELTSPLIRKLENNHQLGRRLVCPEYSNSVQEVKTYPLLSSEQIFFLCWNFQEKGQLRATMYPAPEKFYYSYSFAEHSKTQLHTHDYIELGYVARGTFKQRISDKDVSFSEGEFCLIDKNCIHQDYLISQDALVIFFGIDNQMFDEILKEIASAEKIRTFLETALMKQKEVQQYIVFSPLAAASNTTRAEMENHLSQLLHELYHGDTASAYICKGLMLRIFKLLSTEYGLSISKESHHSMTWMIFEEVCSYIQANYQTIETQDLMNKFHFQKDYFNRLIKKYTGMTYSEYLQDIRLKKAGELLLHTDTNVTEIAELVGYQNKGYFYKIFTEKYGMTPAKYKKSSYS